MHDVFISYSSKNQVIADALCHYLEEQKIRCWIAPRNILPGKDYAEVIDEAITGCKVFILVFSQPSAESIWCNKEVNSALNERKIIIPFRIDSAPISGSMKWYLAGIHWIDAIPDPSSYFKDICRAVKCHLGNPEEQVITPSEQTIQTSSQPEKEQVPELRKNTVGKMLLHVVRSTMAAFIYCFFAMILLQKIKFNITVLLAIPIGLLLQFFLINWMRYDTVKFWKTLKSDIGSLTIPQKIISFLRVLISSAVVCFCVAFYIGIVSGIIVAISEKELKMFLAFVMSGAILFAPIKILHITAMNILRKKPWNDGISFKRVMKMLLAFFGLLILFISLIGIIDKIEKKAVQKKQIETTQKNGITIVATVDGESVPAKVKIGEASAISNPAYFSGLKRNKRYKIKISYKSSAGEYRGEKEILCDWEGNKTIIVPLTLEKKKP